MEKLRSRLEPFRSLFRHAKQSEEQSSASQALVSPEAAQQIFDAHCSFFVSIASELKAVAAIAIVTVGPGISGEFTCVELLFNTIHLDEVESILKRHGCKTYFPETLRYSAETTGSLPMGLPLGLRFEDLFNNGAMAELLNPVKTVLILKCLTPPNVEAQRIRMEQAFEQNSRVLL